MEEIKGNILKADRSPPTVIYKLRPRPLYVSDGETVILSVDNPLRVDERTSIYRQFEFGTSIVSSTEQVGSAVTT